MHSAVTHHSQWRGFFSVASDVARADWEEVVLPPGLPFDLEYCLSISVGGRGGSPTPKPQAEAGSWAVLAAESALALPGLPRG